MPQPTQRSGRYMAGLDGLRALAVIAVIAYHFDWKWAQGGLLGVGVFFVLSGYLITDLLLAEWKRNGRIDLRDFWLRRARRLLPAMFTLLGSVILWVGLHDPPQLARLLKDGTAAALYFSNWQLIFHKVSYFESFGPPSPIGHLWSLAVEEQFYLIWPLLVWIALRLLPRRGLMLALTLCGIAASVLAMVYLYEPGTDPSRVYYGTDTRAFSLLFGAALAVVWPSGKLTSVASRAAVIALDAIGIAGLALFALMVWKVNEYDAFLYPGGMALLSFAATAMVAALAHPSTRFGRWLSVKPLKWVGVRSYGIYLWHYPVIVLSAPMLKSVAAVDPIVVAVIQLAISIALAALSCRLIEEPIRHGALGRAMARVRAAFQPSGRRIGIGAVCLLVCALLAAGAIWFGSAANLFPTVNAHNGGGKSVIEVVYQPDARPQPQQEPQVKPPDPSIDGTATDFKSSPEESAPDPVAVTPVIPVTPVTPVTPANLEDPESPSDPANPPKQPIAPQKDIVTVIGDSVILGAAPYLQELYPNMVIDGKLGRQMSEASAVASRLKADGKLGSRVIIALGSNGAFPKKQLEELLRTLGDERQIVFVNVRVPRKWEEPVNTTLSDAASAIPDAKLADWYKASAGKDDYFYKDGVHLQPEGARAYSSLISEALDTTP